MAGVSTADNRYSRFVVSYDDCNKLYAAVSREDFMRYLALCTASDEESTSIANRFGESDDAWSHRVWFLDGVITFIATKGRWDFLDAEFSVKDDAALTLARTVIDGGYDFSEIFQW